MEISVLPLLIMSRWWGMSLYGTRAKLVRAFGMKNVVVTNGSAELEILEELLPYIDAMNIDLKGFTEAYYRKLGGDLETVKRFIRRSAEACHVELTTLIVPGENDSEKEMEEEARWIASVGPGYSPSCDQVLSKI